MSLDSVLSSCRGLRDWLMTGQSPYFDLSIHPAPLESYRIEEATVNLLFDPYREPQNQLRLGL